MRHAMTTRLVIGVAVFALSAAAVFGVLTNLPRDAISRTDLILGLDPNPANGLDLFNGATQPSCAECHALRDAGAESELASSLDVQQPPARVVVDALVAGTVAEHDAEGFEHNLTNQQISDLAAYIEEVAGH